MAPLGNSVYSKLTIAPFTEPSPKSAARTGSLHSPDDPKAEYSNLHSSGSFRKVICSALHTFRGYNRHRRNTEPTKKASVELPRVQLVSCL